MPASLIAGSRPLASRAGRGALCVALLVLGACQDTTAPGAPVAASTPPMAQNTPPPDYPPELACRQVGGQVVLDVVIGANGVPSGITLVTSSGQKVLDDSAMAAVRGWQFKAATVAGKPVQTKIQVPVTFAPPNPPPDDCNRYL